MHRTHRRESRQIVRRCIDQVPESYRSVLLLGDIDIAEMAAMRALSPNAIKIRVHRARLVLKKLIEGV